MNENKPVKHGALWTVLFAVVSLFLIFPIVLVLINSFKQKAYISKNAFSLPAGCLLYTSPSPRDGLLSRMPSSA